MPLAIVKRGLAGWRGRVEEIENRASLNVAGSEGKALVVLLVLVTEGEEYLSVRAALGT